MEKIVIIASLLSLASCGGLYGPVETRECRMSNCTGAIVQNMTLGPVADDNEINFKASNLFYLLMAVVRAYGHPKEQIAIQLTSPREFTLTFYTVGNAQKDSLLALMNNASSLITRLNEEFQRFEILSRAMVIELSEPIYSEIRLGNVILN